MKTKSPAEQAVPVIIVIDAESRIYLFDEPANLSSLSKSLQNIIGLDKTVPAIVRADKTVMIDRVVQVLDIARGAGVEQIGIAVEDKAQPVPKPK